MCHVLDGAQSQERRPLRRGYPGQAGGVHPLVGAVTPQGLEVLALAAKEAPSGFLIYAKGEAQPLMGLAGDTALGAWYLMGNHTVAERMFRHDSRVLIYAPLRTAITREADGVTRFTFDQPSAQISSFGDPAIAAVGLELDCKVAALLRHLGVAVPRALMGEA